MGFSVSGSYAILVLAAFVALGTMYPVAANSFERVTDAMSASYDDDLARQNTAIEITQLDYQGSHLDVNVTNQGTTALTINDTDLIVDNVYQPREDLQQAKIVGSPNSDLWLPGETLYFRVQLPGGDPQRAKVVTEHGVADVAVVP